MSGKVRRFAVRRKYSEGGIEVITDEDDDDKDTEDESNNNLDEIDKLVLDVVKENVRDIRTAGTPSSGRRPFSLHKYKSKSRND